MKTKSITVERNFHILNDDRFIMEKISWTVELDETDDPYDAIDVARSHVVDNFKHAYPNVETHLNFHVERQVSGYVKGDLPLPKDYVVPNSLMVNYPQPDGSFISEPIDTSIGKGTIEDQIAGSKDLDELFTFKVIAAMNQKLKNIYENKLKELTV